jgi:hypothetical protein
MKFNLVRACFYLLAIILIIEIGSTIAAGFACYRLNVQTRQEIGACLPIIDKIKETWAESLAAIFALLLAARSPPHDGDTNGG